jgi:cobalt-zinc-cadmium resistance protein CzcA
MIERTISESLKQKWIVLIITALIGGAGIYSFSKMNIDAYPDISGVQVQIVTSFNGRAAEEVEKQVTIPLERIMSSVPKIEVIRSRTIFGLALIQVSFEPEVDDYWAREVVYQKLSEADLPEDADSSVASLSTAYGEVFRFELVSEDKSVSEMDLRTLNDWVVIPRLKRAKGVAEVSNFGGKGKIYTVRLDKEKLLRYRATVDDVIKAIKDNNSSGGGSLLDRGSDSLVIRGLGRIDHYKEISVLLIKNVGGTPVFIKDVGSVEIDHLPQTGIFSKDLHGPGVEGIVRMRRGENPSVVLKNIEEAVGVINATLLPKGVKISPFYNRTELVDETLHTVAHNTLLGIGLVVLCLLVFLGDIRVSLIVAATIPLSLLFALTLMYLTDIPISLLSVGAIDFGIIVDGSVIVSENIVRHLHERRKENSVEKTILQSTLQVQKPMFFSMLIVILAYVPLLSLRYIEGLLFKPMAITLCYAFLGALLLALYFVPAISLIAFGKGKAPKEVVYFDRLTEGYKSLLKKCLRHARAITITAFSIMGLVFIFILPRLGTEFLPYMDEGVFWLRANFPEGISLKENAYYSNGIRRIVKGVEEVSFVTSQTGRNDAGTDPFPTNRTEFMVGLKPRDEWKDFKTKLQIERYLQSKLKNEFPTIRLNLTQPIIDSVTEDTNGTSADLAVEIIGPELQVLRKYANQSVELLKTIPGNTNVNIEQEGPQPQLHIAIDRQKLASYQLSGRHVNNVINTAIGGHPVSEIYEGDRKFDIVTKFQKDQVDTPKKIGLVPIFNDAGEALPLGQLSKIAIVDGETLIARSNNQRRMTVRTDIRGGAQGTFAAHAQSLFKKKMKLPSGYRLEWKGMFENLDRAEKHFAILIPMTVLMIFGILLWTYKEVGPSLIVIIAIPASLIGSLVALFIRDMHLSVSAAVGFTSLFGVASMHGVVMVSYLEQYWKERKENLLESIIHAASLRFRPVVMTAVVAFLGLLPASLATGIGSDIQRPIATVIVWGLVTSATITLFVLPGLYYLVEKRNGRDQEN